MNQQGGDKSKVILVKLVSEKSPVKFGMRRKNMISCVAKKAATQDLNDERCRRREIPACWDEQGYEKATSKLGQMLDEQVSGIWIARQARWS